jgi:DNA-binding LacI/PurR family transcriptional regulator
MRVTQKQIARQLGLSPSLVSRALAGTAHLIGADPATVQRIESTARSLGYVPNAAARQLRGAGQPVLGLVVMDLEDPFFGPAVAEVIRQSHAAGYALSLAGFERRKAEAADIQLLLQQDLKALLVLGSGPLDWVNRFLERKVRVIRLGSGSARRPAWSRSPRTRTGACTWWWTTWSNWDIARSRLSGHSFRPTSGGSTWSAST